MNITTNEDLKLWYSKPADLRKSWVEALPLGNGRLGAMVFGGIEKEKLQINEESVWYGGFRDRNNPNSLKYLPEIRRLIFEGKITEAEKLAALSMTGIPEGQRHYDPLGDLMLFFKNLENKDITEYRRELDLNRAVVRVTFKAGDINFNREIFISAVDDVIVIRLWADKPQSITFNALLRRDQFFDRVVAVSDNTIMMKGNTGGEAGMDFRAAAAAFSEGGRTYTLGENLVVENADSAVLLITGATNFKGRNPEDVCLKLIASAHENTYEKLLNSHIEDYTSLFNRMKFDLLSDVDLNYLPTDERLNKLRDGKEDLKLISSYFQFGRYLLICSSRPGNLPANLQGIWNKDMSPAWGSKFTININTQMNYWPAEVCNLPECHLPLFDLIQRMLPNGRHTAEVMYGCKGAVAHHNTDIWADTAPQDIWIPGTYWPMGLAWLCLHIWEHYLFGQDIDFLRKNYGAMKEAAEFFVDFLIEDPKKRLVTCPSVSPENTYILPEGEKGRLCMGPSMDSQIIYSLFTDCIEAAKILGIDSEFSKELESKRDRLPKPEVGKYGQLMEWAEDYEEAEPGHRHISHLFALHPGNMISTVKTPELAKAARVTLERRLANGGGHTGWSKAWIINMWARLEDGENAYENVLELLKKSTQPNLFDSHPPFQIDGNFGGTAGIAEMLLHSHAMELHLLPALPREWTDGEIRGLRARGGLEVSIKWKNGELEYAGISSNTDNQCTVRYKEKVVRFKLNRGEEISFTGNLERI